MLGAANGNGGTHNSRGARVVLVEVATEGARGDIGNCRYLW